MSDSTKLTNWTVARWKGLVSDFTEAGANFVKIKQAGTIPSTLSSGGFIVSFRDASTGDDVEAYVPVATSSQLGSDAEPLQWLPSTGTDITGSSSNGISLAPNSTFRVDVSVAMIQEFVQAGQGEIGVGLKLKERPTFMETGISSDRVFADTTARDAAITSPAEGDTCYVTSIGQQQYNGSTWDTLGVATPVTASLGCEKVGNDIRLDIASTNDLIKLTGNELDTNLLASKAEIDQLQGTTNIAEADTFFGATGITGSEAEQLTNGSNADDLHVHSGSKLNVLTSPIAVTGTEQTIISTNITGGLLSTNNAIKFKIYAFSATGATSDDIVWRLKYGSTTLATITTSGIGENSAVVVEGILSAVGATNSQRGFISGSWSLTSSDKFIGATGTSSEDSTGDLTLTITAQKTSGNRSTEVKTGYIEKLI